MGGIPFEVSELDKIVKSARRYALSGNREHLSSINTRGKVLGVPIEWGEEKESESIAFPCSRKPHGPVYSASGGIS